VAIDLFDLVDPLKREVATPGEFATFYPNTTDDDLLGALQDAFWEARIDGMLEGFTESEGAVAPIGGSIVTADQLGRDFQQLIVLYAGYRFVRNYLMNLKTGFRAQAGPVEYETSQSAQVLRDILAALKDKRNLILARLSDIGAVNSYYIDAVVERTASVYFGDTYWVGS
jgi:hypothetical protein